MCHSNGTPRTGALEASTDQIGGAQGSGVNLVPAVLHSLSPGSSICNHNNNNNKIEKQRAVSAFKKN